MTRILALVGIFLVAGTLCGCSASNGNAELEVKYRYLVVDIVGPPEWEKKHSFSIQWQGKVVQLPIVFRVPGPAENLKLGSEGEISGHLKIGQIRVPVTAKPETQFQVRNTGAVAFIGEKSLRKDTASLSIASSVAISPPEHPGELGPIFKEDKMRSSGDKLGKRLKQLITAGSVIDVALAK